jgi:hypothetical protein
MAGGSVDITRLRRRANRVSLAVFNDTRRLYRNTRGPRSMCVMIANDRPEALAE